MASQRVERLVAWVREFDRPRQAVRRAVLLAVDSHAQLDHDYGGVDDDELSGLVRGARAAVARVEEHLLAVAADLDRLRG